MRRKLLILALLLPMVANAQTEAPVDSLPDFSHPWDLQECMDWAMGHNLTVRAQEASVEQRDLAMNTARYSWLPSVSASASENLSFGRGLSADNTYVSSNTTSTSFSIGAGMNLFDGLATPARIELSRLNLEASLADLEKTRDDIRIAVSKAYVQVLYDYEILEVAREQIAIDSAQVARLEALMHTGRASSAEVSQQRASYAQSVVTLTQAENNLIAGMLDLCQLLELPLDPSFVIARPEVDAGGILLPSVDDIYADAVGTRPSVRAEQLRLDGTAQQLRIARSALYPSLSLSGGIGSNYYSMKGSNTGFWDQLSNNFSQYIGLSLNIPIFNRFETRNNIRSAELDAQRQSLQVQTAKQSLYKEIQQAWNNAAAAQAKYNASGLACSAAADAFELVQAKYENGRATITEFNEARNQLMKTRSDLVQATYEYVFQTRILQFYRGEKISL